MTTHTPRPEATSVATQDGTAGVEPLFLQLQNSSHTLDECGGPAGVSEDRLRSIHA